MAQRQPKQIIDDIAQNYLYKNNRWETNEFRYQSWLSIADRMIADHNYIDGYWLQGLVYHIYGQHKYASTSAEMLLKYDVTHEAITLYTVTLYDSGEVRKAHEFFLQQFQGIPLTQYTGNELLLKFTLCQIVFDQESLNAMANEIISTPTLNNEEMINFATKYVHHTQSNRALIQSMHLDIEMVIDVVAIAVREFYARISGLLGLRFESNSPTDDLSVTIFSKEIDREIMLELNEAWLEAMLDYESSYDFTQLSRVLVSYRPVTGDFGGQDASEY